MKGFPAFVRSFVRSFAVSGSSSAFVVVRRSFVRRSFVRRSFVRSFVRSSSSAVVFFPLFRRSLYSTVVAGVCLVCWLVATVSYDDDVDCVTTVQSRRRGFSFVAHAVLFATGYKKGGLFIRLLPTRRVDEHTKNIT